MSVDKVCNKIAGHINRSNKAQGVLTKIGKNPAIFSAVASFGIASVAKPLVLKALPFKNDRDRKCSQASSIATGLMDIATTTAIFIPLNKAINTASSTLVKNKGTFFEGNKEAVRQFGSITNRGFRLLLIVPISIWKMSLIKPLMDNFLCKKKDEKRKLDKWA